MWTPEEQAAIEQAIQDKAPDLRACPFCGKRAGYTLADDFVILSMGRSPGAHVAGGPSLPSIALVCRRCGQTTFLNAVVLGLQALLPAAKAKPAESS
jgi:hypothetical protein